MTIEASQTSAGKLELRSTETGADAKISIAGASNCKETAVNKWLH